MIVFTLRGLTVELEKWTDNIAAFFDHIEVFDQVAVVIKSLVVQLLNVKETHVTVVSVHSSFDEKSCVSIAVGPDFQNWNGILVR